MQDFRKLRIWQENRLLTVAIYRATASFPREERYGLTAQIRDAVVSIGANIAEGCGRGSTADSLRFYQFSFASSTELLHHLITSMDLGFLSAQDFETLDRQLEGIRRGIAKFMSRVRNAR